MKNKLTYILFLITIMCFGQKNLQKDWTKNETSQYQNLKALSSYIYKKQKTEISKDTLFNKYVFFDYVLDDTREDRKNKRLANLILYFILLEIR